MTTPREIALADLRAWSAPGTRARLIRQAWDAGEHRVSVLADTAGITRQTAYDDLESQGINPRTDRTEETAMFQTIAVDGLTGTDAETTNDAFRTAYERHAGAGPDIAEGFAQWAVRYTQAHNVARVHNALVPLANAAAEARQEAQRALRVVETRWDALRTARHWLAAHHAYVEAVHVARRRTAAWENAARAALNQARELVGDRGTENFDSVYNNLVPEGDRITIDSDDATLALTELEETHRQRRAITAETLTHRLDDQEDR